MKEMPDEVIKNSLRRIEEAQTSIKNRKIEFENERKEDKERGRERSIIMLGFEMYQTHRVSETLREGTEKYKEALEKKGKARIDLATEGVEILDSIGFGWSEELPEDTLRHIAMMEYMANFARTGKPKGHHLPKWKEWSNKEGKDKAIVFDAGFDDPLISMTDEEVLFDDIDAELTAEIATWDPINQIYWGWLPWWFQWSSPE